MTTQQYDYIVVGSGIAGLYSAVLAGDRAATRVAPMGRAEGFVVRRVGTVAPPFMLRFPSARTAVGGGCWGRRVWIPAFAGMTVGLCGVPPSRTSEQASAGSRRTVSWCRGPGKT